MGKLIQGIERWPPSHRSGESHIAPTAHPSGLEEGLTAEPGVGASRGARAPPGENKAAARCWHQGLSVLGQEIIESASGLRQQP